MVTAASGVISLPEKHLRTMLSSLSAFQTWVGAADATEALDSIYIIQPPAPASVAYTLAELQAVRPFAVIFTEPDAGVEGTKDSSDTVAHEGTLSVIFEAESDAAAAAARDVAEIYRLFNNAVGDIIGDLDAASTIPAAGHLNVTHWQYWGPQRADEEERAAHGDYVRAELKVRWAG